MYLHLFYFVLTEITRTIISFYDFSELILSIHVFNKIKYINVALTLILNVLLISKIHIKYNIYLV